VDVSFIIVSWNARSYLLKCLASLRATGNGYTSEIFVVDNASTDGSQEAVRQQFPEVILIENAGNLGFARANNVALARAKGRFLCLVNSDVEVFENCVQNLIGVMQNLPKIGMLGPKLLEADGKTQTSCWGFPGLWNMFCCALYLDKLFPNQPLLNGYELRHQNRGELRAVDILGGAFWFARREAVASVGGLDEQFFMYGEDMDWCKRFWQNGWEIWYCPGAVAVHYGGASSANAPTRFYVEMQRANLQYWKKHHSWTARVLIRLIYFLHHMVRVGGHFAGMLVRLSRRQEHWFKLRRSLACLGWLVGRRPAVQVSH